MTDTGAEYIRFDIPKIKKLAEDYEYSLNLLLANLPQVNYDSQKQVKEFFKNSLNVMLKDTKIATIREHLNAFPDGSEEHELIETLLAYLRIKFSIKNYLHCILTHEENGVVQLRWENNRLCMPNRQPLPYNIEIQECILEMSRHVPAYLPQHM
jgi:hypothetical protein